MLYTDKTSLSQTQLKQQIISLIIWLWHKGIHVHKTDLTNNNNNGDPISNSG